MAQAFRSRTIQTMVPGSPPIHDGLLVTDSSTIQAVGPYKDLKKSFSGPFHDLGEQVMVPGLINAHTHLELSHLHEKTTPGQGFETWVRSLLHNDLKGVDSKTLHRVTAELSETGTAGIGDISGHVPTTMFEHHRDGPLQARLFLEHIGFSRHHHSQLKWPSGLNPDHHDWLSAAGHALYSTHPSTLQVIKTWCTQNGRPFSMHLAEHAGEMELLTTGRGPFAEMLKGSLLPADFVPPGISPVAYADQLGLLDEKTLTVHCVFLNKNDMQTLQERKATVCLCPRSNAYINVGQAPAEQLFTTGVPICLGTDSLASNTDVNLWFEAQALLSSWSIPLALNDLLSFLTLNPARVLGLDHTLGTLEPGKRDSFTTVPASVLEMTGPSTTAETAP